jgi:hypothetical protein
VLPPNLYSVPKPKFIPNLIGTKEPSLLISIFDLERSASETKAVAVVVPVAVAEPIVGALGLLGHTLAPTDCICWVAVQIPLAVLVDVVGEVAEMTPPL